jgi:hypothetical protein
MPNQTANAQEGSALTSQSSIGEIFSKRAANMNRLLSRREKDGGAHRRAKSRDKSAEKKVKRWKVSYSVALTHTGQASSFFSLYIVSLRSLSGSEWQELAASSNHQTSYTCNNC